MFQWLLISHRVQVEVNQWCTLLTFNRKNRRKSDSNCGQFHMQNNHRLTCCRKSYLVKVSLNAKHLSLQIVCVLTAMCVLSSLFLWQRKNPTDEPSACILLVGRQLFLKTVSGLRKFDDTCFNVKFLFPFCVILIIPKLNWLNVCQKEKQDKSDPHMWSPADYNWLLNLHRNYKNDLKRLKS